MRRFIRRLRALRDDQQGSMPLQYALVTLLTTVVTTMIAQTVSSKVADKVSTVTSALNKIQF